MFVDLKSILNVQLTDAGKIAFTTDIWTKIENDVSEPEEQIDDEDDYNASERDIDSAFEHIKRLPCFCHHLQCAVRDIDKANSGAAVRQKAKALYSKFRSSHKATHMLRDKTRKILSVSLQHGYRYFSAKGFPWKTFLDSNGKKEGPMRTLQCLSSFAIHKPCESFQLLAIQPEGIVVAVLPLHTCDPVALLQVVDGFSGHDENVNDPLGQVTVFKFPPNITSVYQPLDQRIIATLKTGYKNRLLEKVVASVANYNELQVMAKQLPAGSAGLQYGCSCAFEGSLG
ncbi:hypothetical protein EMCRGX_G016671 [Ephydatia muelleri]